MTLATDLAAFQTGSVGLKRAGDPQSLGRVAGLEFAAKAPNGSWPSLLVRGGVQAYGTQLTDMNDSPSFQTINYSSLGTISIPGDSVPDPTETSTWASIKLAYASEFDLTLSRLTPAALLETSKTSVRFCSGDVTTITTNGTALTDPATTTKSKPKYIAYHTSGGYQVTALSGSSTDLTGMDQPWLLLYWGNQSHWCDCTLPMNYSHEIGQGWRSFPHRYALQADCPLLLVFSDNPTAATQDATAKGLDLTLPSGAKKISIFPLYGRLRQDSATTNGWNSGANLASGAKTLIQAWYPRLGYFPTSVEETYTYDDGVDAATVTETVAWTTVNGTSGTKFCPLPPFLGVALDTSLADLDVTVTTAGSGGTDVPGTVLAVPSTIVPGSSPTVGGDTTTATVVDGAVPTDYGPTLGIADVDAYSWTLTGLAPYTAARAAPGSGGVPAGLQAEIDAQVDALIAEDHWSPWYFADRLPQPQPGGSIYFANPADTLALVSELVPLVSGSRQTDLIDWLTTERTDYPPETVYDVAVDTVNDGNRGPLSIPNTHGPQFFTAAHPASFLTRQWLWACWGLARYYQETGASLAGLTIATNLLGLVTDDQAEQDWATSYWFAGYGDRATAVENVNRHWGGLAGLAWLMEQKSDANEGIVRCLLAKATVTRVAMAHLPRYLASVGLITLPSDLGSDNPRFLPYLAAANTSFYQGFNWPFDWTTSADDPRQIVFCDQFQAFLDDSNARLGWNAGEEYTYQPPYVWLVEPLARLLDDAVGAELTIYHSTYATLQPHWWLPFADGVLGQEHNLQHPTDSFGMFLISAWVLGADAATLRRQAGFSWLTP